MLGTRALGIYAVAVGVTFVPVQIGAGLAYASFRRVRPSDRPGPDGPAATLLRRAWLLVTAACALTGIAIAVGLELVYGHDFSSAVAPALLLLPASLFLGLHLVATQVANALEAPEDGSIGQVVGVVVTVVGLIVALPDQGIEGAAVVSSVAAAVRYLVTVGLLRRRGVWGTLPGLRDVRSLVDDGRRVVTRGRDRTRWSPARSAAPPTG
jgi:O-antigen/teichoic acid export membrane protein